MLITANRSSQESDVSYYPHLRLDGSMWNDYLQFASLRSLPKGTTVVRAGEHVTGMSFLAQGLLRYSISNANGDAKTLGMLEPGTVVGDGPIFLNKPSMITVETLTPCDTYFFPRQVVLDLITDHSELAYGIIVNLAGKFRMLLRQVSDLCFHDLRTRLASVLFLLFTAEGSTCEGGLEKTIGLSHEELASLIGGQRARVTTLLGELRDDGILALGSRNIRLLDMVALCSIARLARPAGELTPCGERRCQEEQVVLG